MTSPKTPAVGSRRLNNALLTDWATKVAPTTLSMRQLNGGGFRDTLYADCLHLENPSTKY
ncbi:MAG: hypothetical protein Q7T40_11865 [Methylobacter sp.]|nr:hypothetical protein [Methylobacter sp.]